MFTLTVTAQADAWTPEAPGGGLRCREHVMRSPGPRGQRSLHGSDRERGTITLMLLVMFVALLALAGIVIDGGAKLDQAENANAIAQEAARAGAGLVNQSKALATGSFTIDQAQALAAAQQYLARAGYQGTAVPDGPDAIRVTVTVIAPTHVLSIIGIDSMRSTGSATASLVTRVTGPGK
jgi:Flp pilus assembly protein TadG